MNKLLGAGLLALTVLLAGCSDDKDDTTKPTVSIPAISAVTSAGSVTVTANASDNKGIESVAFYDNGTFVSSDTSSPYTATLNYTAANNGVHTIRAVATDKNNNTAETTSTITVNIASVTPTPTAALTNLLINPPTIDHTKDTTVAVTGTYTGTIDHIQMTIAALSQTIDMGKATMDGSGNFTFNITPAVLGPTAAGALKAGLIKSADVTATAYDSSGKSLSTLTKTLTVN